MHFRGIFTGHPAHVRYKSARAVLATEDDALPTFAVAPGAGKLDSQTTSLLQYVVVSNTVARCSSPVGVIPSKIMGKFP